MCMCVQVMQGRLERKTPSPTMLLTMVSTRGNNRETNRLPLSVCVCVCVRQDAFSENSKHLQKALIAYLHKRSQTDPSCAVSFIIH